MRLHLFSTVSIALAILATATFCKPEVNRDPLSAEYALRLNRNPGSGTMEQQAAIEKARALVEAGIADYKNKQAEAAVAKYFEALKYHASGKTYYHLGNSLMNLERFADAATAYQHAALLRYERTELALYNTACAYSRLENLDEAYKYLRRAMDRGYNAFNYVRQDPDMAFLRAQSDWESRLRSMVPVELEYDETTLNGRMALYGMRWADIWYLCANGVVLFKNECAPGFNRGRWRLENGAISMQYYENCTQEGIDRIDYPNNTNPYACTSYESYGPPRCETREKQYVPDPISQGDIREGLRNPDEPETLKFDRSDQEPIQCDPKFIPKTPEELKVAAFDYR
ncbi:MAG: hypothetical protein NXI24_24490 [bacterium]|nr:hypothetical protein [bacterium]